MKKNKYAWFVRIIFPSYSEFEFIFLTSLLVSVLVAGVVTHLHLISSHIFNHNSDEWYPTLTIAAVIGLIAAAYISAAYKLAAQRKKVTSIKKRAGFIAAPTYMLMMIGLTQLTFQQKYQATGFSIAGLAAGIITIRYFAVFFVIKVLDVAPRLQQAVAGRFDGYQVNKTQAIAAVLLGIVGTLLISLTHNWLLWILIVHDVGITLIAYYRKNWAPIRS